MIYLCIALLHCLYIPAIWYGLISDDEIIMKTDPYPVKREKIGSILLHLCVAEYIYFAFNCSLPATIVALWFSIHPLTVQVSIWRTGQHWGINALLFLMSWAWRPYSAPILLICTLIYLIPKNNAKLSFIRKGLVEHNKIGSLILAPLVYLFTPYWYVAIASPLLIWLNYKELTAFWQAKIKGDGLFTMPLPKDFTLHKFHWQKPILAVKTYGYYALACLLPIKNGFYNSFLVTLGSTKKETDYWYSLNRHFWGGLFALCLMACLWWVNRGNLIGMGIMLFTVGLIPYANMMTAQQYTAPRYAYLPLIGFQIAFVSVLFKYFPPNSLLNASILSGIACSLFLFYLDRMLRVRRHYAKNNATQLELDAEVFPDNARIWYMRHAQMMHKGNALMAWAEAAYGLKHLPEDCQLWFMLACSSFELGDMNAAKEFLDTSERFLILTEKQDMVACIAELRQRIRDKLMRKFSIQPRFRI